MVCQVAALLMTMTAGRASKGLGAREVSQKASQQVSQGALVGSQEAPVTWAGQAKGEEGVMSSGWGHGWIKASLWLKSPRTGV